MKAHYYRYLFETISNGVIQAGSIYDDYVSEGMNYVYMSGSHNETLTEEKSRKIKKMAEKLTKDTIDLVVIGEFTAVYTILLYCILKHTHIRTVVMPYIAPVRRMALVQMVMEYMENSMDILQFVRHPYTALKNMGVEKVFFLYDNGQNISQEEILDTDDGEYFEMVDTEIIEQVRGMEGEYIPVVKAGYMIQNGWIFYFGNYGMNVGELSRFTRRYYTREAYERAIRHSENELYHIGMFQLMNAYTKTYGIEPYATVVMYIGPVRMKQSGKEVRGALFAQPFAGSGCCVPFLDDEAVNCTLKCLRCNDHDVLRHQFEEEKSELQMGLLLLGNIDLHQYKSEIVLRFKAYMDKVRAIMLPEMNTAETWEKSVLSYFPGKDKKYWIANITKSTNAEILKDIIMYGNNNQVVNIKEQRGYCFSGYLMDIDERSII